MPGVRLQGVLIRGGFRGGQSRGDTSFPYPVGSRISNLTSEPITTSASAAHCTPVDGVDNGLRTRTGAHLPRLVWLGSDRVGRAEQGFTDWRPFQGIRGTAWRNNPTDGRSTPGGKSVPGLVALAGPLPEEKGG